MIIQTQYPFDRNNSSDLMLPLAVIFGTALVLIAVKIHTDNQNNASVKPPKNEVI